MAGQSYIDAATDAQIEAEMANVFATRKVLGTTYDIVLQRDATNSGDPVSLPPQNVLFSLASREPTAVSQTGSRYMGQDGALEKELPFDVQKGDRFRVPEPGGGRGKAAVITMVVPVKGGVLKALFTLQA